MNNIARLTLPYVTDTREAAVPENPLKDAFFGDMHVHTSYSLDAYIGGARLTPFDAYRFAKGEDFPINNVTRNIGRPLDFTAVSDHAEYLGEMLSTQIPIAPGHYKDALVELRGQNDIDTQRAWFLEYVVKNARSGAPGHPPFFAGVETTESAWKDVIVVAAEKHNDPGKFTTFIAFEWTSAPNAGNMHRNVIFRDNVVPDVPLTSIDTTDEEELWKWMSEQEASGSTLLAIPHNSNGSKGQMFEPVDNAGNPLTRAYAENRAKWETLKSANSRRVSNSVAQICRIEWQVPDDSKSDPRRILRLRISRGTANVRYLFHLAERHWRRSAQLSFLKLHNSRWLQKIHQIGAVNRSREYRSLERVAVNRPHTLLL